MTQTDPSQEFTIAVLAGDGIGPEVVSAALRVLDVVVKRFGLKIKAEEALIGGAAYEQTGSHLPQQTLELAAKASAILFGSVGGPVSGQHLPKWQNCETNSLLGIRKHFDFAVNYRPVKVYLELAELCPLKPELLAKGIDILIIRELVGGIYFGEHRQFQTAAGLRAASDVAEYDETQIRTAVVAGFKAASQRRCHLTAVDKANVLATSKLWRTIVEEVAADHPEVCYQHMLVDNAAMQLVKNPAQFDVIVTENMFGDILSDTAAVLPGSLGLTPSASLNSAGFGMYEPSGGSAPDIAGQNIANPVAQILSLAMLLRTSLGLNSAANAIEAAVSKCFSKGLRTQDLVTDPGANFLGTNEFTAEICRVLEEQA